MICVCCDRPLKPEEIIWIPERGVHEDLCKICRKIVQESLLYSDFAGPNTSLTHIESDTVETEPDYEE